MKSRLLFCGVKTGQREDQRMKNVMAGLAIVVSMGITIQAAPLEIIGIEQDGGLLFQGGSVNNYFTLEFSGHPEGPWTNWGSLSERSITGTVMAVQSPLFFRVREATTNNYRLTNYLSNATSFGGTVTGTYNNLHLADDAVGFDARQTGFRTNNTYLATTDGFVVWRGFGGQYSPKSFVLLYGGNPPTSTGAAAYIEIDTIADGSMTITCPIRRGEYWRARSPNTDAYGGRIDWVPLSVK